MPLRRGQRAVRPSGRRHPHRRRAPVRSQEDLGQRQAALAGFAGKWARRLPADPRSARERVADSAHRPRAPLSGRLPRIFSPSLGDLLGLGMVDLGVKVGRLGSLRLGRPARRGSSGSRSDPRSGHQLGMKAMACPVQHDGKADPGHDGDGTWRTSPWMRNAWHRATEEAQGWPGATSSASEGSIGRRAGAGPPSGEASTIRTVGSGTAGPGCPARCAGRERPPEGPVRPNRARDVGVREAAPRRRACR